MSLNFRLATKDDSAVVLTLRNDPSSVAASEVDRPVESREHEVWFAKVLQDGTRRLLIASEADIAVGAVRLDGLDDGRVAISIIVAPDARGRGVGKAMLTFASRYALRWLNAEVLVARIRDENSASRRMFERVGYRLVSSQAGIAEYHQVRTTGLSAVPRRADISLWNDAGRKSGDWLFERSSAGAAALLRQGVSAGDRIAIAHGGTPEFFADLFAVWRIGACAVCLNPALTPDELSNICAFVRPRAVLTGGAGAAKGLGDYPVFTLRDAPRFDADPAQIDAGAVADKPADEALILFTSGTTGIPKGVVHTYGSLQARIASNIARIGAGTMANTLCVLPTHFGHGLIGNCLSPLLAGAHLVLAPGGNLDVLGKLGRIVDDRAITFMSSVPSFWKKVVAKSAPPEKGTLRRVHIGSAPLSGELWNAVADWAGTRQVFNMYGITETANWLAGAALDTAGALDGAVGAAWDGEVALLASSGEIVREGSGEVVVKTCSLMKGYLDRPDLTRTVMHDGWFRTGDLGSIGKDASLRIGGRLKSEINRGGIKICPEDIDLLLERHGDVREACAFAVPHDIEGETVGVAVSLESGAGITVQDLRKWAAAGLTREKMPEHWFIVDDIPKTDRGKINREVVCGFCFGGEKV